jgi:16S rRNA G966 N2-methylase RsmD
MNQKEIVTQLIIENPKHINEIATEANIKLPNVRRIVGIETKKGTFKRIAKGVYVASNGNTNITFVECGNSIESLNRLASEGFKSDMIFLDIPYDTPAVKGGNRGVKYDLVSLSDFDSVLNDCKKILRNENSPIVYMCSQAPSGLKQMNKYTAMFDSYGFKAVKDGFYQKTFADGSPVTSPNGKVSQAEKIIIFTLSGKIETEVTNLEFTFKRPKGYQTEKAVGLIEGLVKQTTKENDMILDPFAGSGVVGEVSVTLNRSSYSIEINQTVVDERIIPRIEKALAS